MTDEQCSKKLWMNYGYHQCFRKAVVCRDGRWYCKQHDPGDHEKAQTWWRACIFLSTQIFPIEVVSTTKSMVLLEDGRSQRKVTEDSWICPTFEEAKECLVEYLERKVTRYASRLERAERDLEAARKLEEPTSGRSVHDRDNTTHSKGEEPNQ